MEVKDDYVTCRLSKNISHDVKLCECAFAASFGSDRLCRREDLRAHYDEDKEEEPMTLHIRDMALFNIDETHRTRSGRKFKLVHIFPRVTHSHIWASESGSETIIRTTIRGEYGYSGEPAQMDIIIPSQFEIGKTYRTDSEYLVRLIYILNSQVDCPLIFIPVNKDGTEYGYSFCASASGMTPYRNRQEWTKILKEEVLCVEQKS